MAPSNHCGVTGDLRNEDDNVAQNETSPPRGAGGRGVPTVTMSGEADRYGTERGGGEGHG